MGQKSERWSSRETDMQADRLGLHQRMRERMRKGEMERHGGEGQKVLCVEG